MNVPIHNVLANLRADMVDKIEVIPHSTTHLVEEAFDRLSREHGRDGNDPTAGEP